MSFGRVPFQTRWTEGDTVMRSARRATSVAAEATNVSSAQTSFIAPPLAPHVTVNSSRCCLNVHSTGTPGLPRKSRSCLPQLARLGNKETEPSCGHRQQWQDWELRGAVRIAQLMDSELALVLRDC